MARMQDAYRSGDPYLAFAKKPARSRRTPRKPRMDRFRDLYKIVILGTQYGMHSAALATKIGQSESVAADLLRRIGRPTRRFGAGRMASVDFAMQRNFLYTVFDWRLHVGPMTTDRSLRNFPCQANGAECLRLACVYALQRGVKVIAPVHDALLIEAPDDQIDHAVRTTQEAMAAASAAVLGGFALTLRCEGDSLIPIGTPTRAGSTCGIPFRPFSANSIRYGSLCMFNLDDLRLPDAELRAYVQRRHALPGDSAVSSFVRCRGTGFRPRRNYRAPRFAWPYCSGGKPACSDDPGISRFPPPRSRFRIKRHAYYQTLRALEAARLITVDDSQDGKRESRSLEHGTGKGRGVNRQTRDKFASGTTGSN